jgi:hypothetical protein
MDTRPRSTYKSQLKRHTPDLAVAVKLEEEKKNWPTPTVQDAKNVKGSSQQKRNSLSVSARVQLEALSTPTVRDSAEKPLPPRKPHPGGGQKPGLLQQTGGALSPTFVEYLMAYPLEWTVLSPLAMQWFLAKQKRHL